MHLRSGLENVLVGLGKPLCHEADTLLDLRECALNRNRPGRCVACYFTLRAAAKETALDKLAALRHWLETHIEVVACDAEARRLETLPLHLETACDLEKFCCDVMAEFRDNRAYKSSLIQLEFRYRDLAKRAA